MKILLIVGDGMADRPLKDLNHLTPLEAAKPRNMNELASEGISGLLYAVAPGIIPGSDVANLSILGYNPYKVYTGRGGFEAAGAGIELEDEDLAFRCNFATVNDDFIVVDEKAGRLHDYVAAELEKELQNLRLKTASDIQVVFRHTVGFKGAMVLRGEGLCLNVWASMPKAGLQADAIRPKDNSFEAKKTANALNEFIRETHRILKNHPVNKKREKEGLPPANIVIPWGGGKKPHLKSLNEKYELKGACVAAVSLIKGLCKLAGMSIIHVSGATGDVNTDAMAKADAALKALENHDFVMVHVEGPDEASHDGDINGKIKIIKKIDGMVGKILEHINLEETCVALLSDHTTSTKLRMHTADPAPITMASTEVIMDGVSRYSEREAYKGGLGHIRGKHVLPMLLNLMGRSVRFGA